MGCTVVLWRKGLIRELAYIIGLQVFTNFGKTVCMLVSTSHKRSHLSSCDLNMNVHDVEVPVCKTQKVLDIPMNRVLDYTVEYAAKR